MFARHADCVPCAGPGTRDNGVWETSYEMECPDVAKSQPQWPCSKPSSQTSCYNLASAGKKQPSRLMRCTRGDQNDSMCSDFEDDAAFCSDILPARSSPGAGITLLHSSSSQLSCDLEFILPAVSEVAHRDPLACSEELSRPALGSASDAATGSSHRQTFSWQAVGFGRLDVLNMIRNEQRQEASLRSNNDYMSKHGAPTVGSEFLTPQMRMIVTSWMSEVATEFNLQQETLFLAVALLDRFLCASSGVPRGVLQLVAVTAMFIAAKQDEVRHPSVEEMTDIAANCFRKEDLLRMERIILDTLSWRIKTPTAYTFLHLYTQAQAHAPQPHVTAAAAYLVELALLEYDVLAWTPSQVAAAALLLAQSWSSPVMLDDIQELSGYSAAELQPCMQQLVTLHQCAAGADMSEALQPLLFIREKYSAPCWLGVACQMAPPSQP